MSKAARPPLTRQDVEVLEALPMLSLREIGRSECYAPAGELGRDLRMSSAQLRESVDRLRHYAIDIMERMLSSSGSRIGYGISPLAHWRARMLSESCRRRWAREAVA